MFMNEEEKVETVVKNSNSIVEAEKKLFNEQAEEESFAKDGVSIADLLNTDYQTCFERAKLAEKSGQGKILNKGGEIKKQSTLIEIEEEIEDRRSKKEILYDAQLNPKKANIVLTENITTEEEEQGAYVERTTTWTANRTKETRNGLSVFNKEVVETKKQRDIIITKTFYNGTLAKVETEKRVGAFLLPLQKIHCDSFGRKEKTVDYYYNGDLLNKVVTTYFFCREVDHKKLILKRINTVLYKLKSTASTSISGLVKDDDILEKVEMIQEEKAVPIVDNNGQSKVDVQLETIYHCKTNRQILVDKSSLYIS